jgi:C1A family cysteine protease
MKKIIGLVILMLFISTTLTSVGMNNKIKEETIIDITQKTQIYENENYNFEYIPINKEGIFNPPVMNIEFEQLLDDSISPSYGLQPIDLPEYFSWKDHNGQDWTTSAKNQGSCGSCWGFAALGILESIINIKEGISDLNPDLSEQYLLSCLPSAGSCNGGFVTMAFLRILNDDAEGNNCNGIIPEQCFRYEGDDTIPCEKKSENWEDYLIPITSYGRITEDNMKEAIKSRIINNGPVTSSMCATNENFTVWGYTNHNSDDYFPYELGGGADHAVIIVGWKDDSSIGKGGYWICKNSWGPTFGYNGFFNIEYDSLKIGGEPVWVDYSSENYSWHPVPNMNDPYYGLVDEPIEFWGNASGESPPFTYYWEFGDGTISTDKNPTHSYSNSGEYTVKLTVTDDNGKSMWEKNYAWIQESNSPPDVPKIEGSSEAIKGEYCWYNITFSDPDGSPLYLYVVAFGFESNIWWGPYPPIWYKEFLHFYWDEEGDYIVKAKVKDPYGAESDWATLEVTVPRSRQFNDYNPWISRVIERFPILEFLL